MSPTISVILPMLNEAAGIQACLNALAGLRERGAEVIVVDGGSKDDSVALSQGLADQFIQAPRGRAKQMMAGATAARANVLLFLHADTRLPEGADRAIANALDAGAQWGRFDVKITGRSSMLPVIAAMMNRRSRWSGIATGDQAMFVQRELFERVGGFPDQPLMEDIELSKRLRAVAPPACLPETVLTSGRRWEQHGVWRTIFLMWRLRWLYWRGVAPATLAAQYK
ncbi:TIGR04283 family arsenosugar biosynthesis glycosyltransferase [Roseateles oligotrophus]|uniref:TIGR04283 family arsenosugar biosynthesis glycosyltransferase n=1 Tax=Roseateles oligotrophus TaxID=1769250 RepID=A0ABT2YH37_9BURK|nr:TIGR04283 family arsenosugar biosynthesis glycosyltransferase [Roseateles oligotrophus]MCV2369365.1 TIGR04283 family arsenosugar biosynthesis glycosyltransferase [Roseateles oligotrophus]